MRGSKCLARHARFLGFQVYVKKTSLTIYFQRNTCEGKLKVCIGEELSIFAIATYKRIFNENKLKSRRFISKQKKLKRRKQIWLGGFEFVKKES